MNKLTTLIFLSFFSLGVSASSQVEQDLETLVPLLIQFEGACLLGDNQKCTQSKSLERVIRHYATDICNYATGQVRADAPKKKTFMKRNEQEFAKQFVEMTVSYSESLRQVE